MVRQGLPRIVEFANGEHGAVFPADTRKALAEYGRAITEARFAKQAASAWFNGGEQEYEKALERFGLELAERVGAADWNLDGFTMERQDGELLSRRAKAFGAKLRRKEAEAWASIDYPAFLKAAQDELGRLDPVNLNPEKTTAADFIRAEATFESAKTALMAVNYEIVQRLAVNKQEATWVRRVQAAERRIVKLQEAVDTLRPPVETRPKPTAVSGVGAIEVPSAAERAAVKASAKANAKARRGGSTAASKGEGSK